MMVYKWKPYDKTLPVTMDHPMQKEKPTNERTQSWFWLSYTTKEYQKVSVCNLGVDCRRKRLSNECMINRDHEFDRPNQQLKTEQWVYAVSVLNHYVDSPREQKRQGSECTVYLTMNWLSYVTIDATTFRFRQPYFGVTIHKGSMTHSDGIRRAQVVKVVIGVWFSSQACNRGCRPGRRIRVRNKHRYKMRPT